jgi:hypothetical protein
MTYQVWVWLREDGGHWERDARYDTQAQAEAAVRRFERVYGAAADWEFIEESP